MLGVPVVMIAAYAVQMLFAYMTRLNESMHAEYRIQLNTGVRSGELVLAAERWAFVAFQFIFLIYYGVNAGWVKPVTLLVTAFIASLGLRYALVIAVRGRLGSWATTFTVIGFGVLPICAVAMILSLP